MRLRKLILIAGILLLGLIVLLLTKTFLYRSLQIPESAVDKVPVSDSAILHLSEAVRFRTISYDDPAHSDTAAFNRQILYLRNTYPHVTAVLHPKVISNSSLFYCWKGSDTLLPSVLLIGHLDVVPAADPSKWDKPPFSGAVSNGFIWGRGTLDDKVSVISTLEAVEMLLKENFKPKRTVYLAFGQDEEVGGEKGGGKIVQYLQQQKIKAGFLLDEGMMIARGIVPGIAKDVALIGIAEKGYLSLELSVDAEAGHSSLPPKETAIGILAAAVSRLEQNPMPAGFCVPVNEFLDHIGPEMPFFNRMAFANRWLFKSLILSKYESTHAGRSVVRTSTAVTEFHSGVKENVIPAHASAIVNFRILPGETSSNVIRHVKEVINDERVRLERYGHGNEPTSVSDNTSEGYNAIRKTISQVFPGVLVSPSLVVAATDARHYAPVANNLYRFIPIVLQPDDLDRIHGLNERIAAEDFKNCVRFFRQLIYNCNR